MHGQGKRRRIAIIGSGISGLSVAWLLSRTHDVVVYERSRRLGGHCCTIYIPGVGPVDMGFIVYNEAMCPNLVQLFRYLGVDTRPSNVSFSVSMENGTFEYAGTSPLGLLAQPSNILRPRFWSVLAELARFRWRAPRDARRLPHDLTTLDAYLKQHRFSKPFARDHLLPMAAAIWSIPPDEIGQYPAAAFIRFFENQVLLRLSGQVVWRTVVGGSRAYLEKLVAGFAGGIRPGCAATEVWRHDSGVRVKDAMGGDERFDEVVLATHAPEALALLADPSDVERGLLSKLNTRQNRAVMHRDPRLMPRRKAAWAGWNYIESSLGALSVTYWMNRLQPLAGDRPVFVSLNPPIEPKGIIHEETFAHPQFDDTAMRVQRPLWSLQGTRHTWFAGAWLGAGFHEDGLEAGLTVAELLGGKRRPWDLPEGPSRIPKIQRIQG